MTRLHKIIWSGLLGAVVAVVLIALYAESRRTALPILNHLHPFRLTNQLGEAVSLESLKGHVVVANIIFSRCPTQCHQLSRQMARLQQSIGAETKLVSLTADPEFDTPVVLANYGERYGTDSQKWWFLTGPKAEVYRVAEKDLLFTVMDAGEADPKLEDRFIHAGNFVVLDRQGRLRAVVQGEEPDAERRLLDLTRQLARETNFCDAHDLPAFNATLNGIATILLTAGWIFIRTGRRIAHRNCMVAAFVTSMVFLVGYLYHKFVVMKGIHTTFPGPRSLLVPYLIMLVTHVVLAMAIVPLAVVSMHRGLKERFELHKKIARWTLPLWLYVSVTGVIIYVLLYQVWVSP